MSEFLSEFLEFKTILMEYIRPTWPLVDLEWPEPIEVGPDLFWPSPLPITEYVDGVPVKAKAGVLAAGMMVTIMPSALDSHQDRFGGQGLTEAITWLRQAHQQARRKRQAEIAAHPKLTRYIMSLAESAVIAGVVPEQAVRVSPGSVAACACLVALSEAKRQFCAWCHDVTGTPYWLPIEAKPSWCPARIVRFGHWGTMIPSCLSIYFRSTTFTTIVPEATWRRYQGVGTPRSAAVVIKAIMKEREKWQW